jgi:hypothetical protein
MAASIQKKDKELARKAKQQQKRQRKLERRVAVDIPEPRRNGIDLAVAVAQPNHMARMKRYATSK